MKDLCAAVDTAAFGQRDEGTEYVCSSMPMNDPYTHLPMWAATLTSGGKIYEVTIKEIGNG